MIEICVMSFTTEIHADRLKTGVGSASALNRSIVKRGTMTTMVPVTTNLTNGALPKGGYNAGGVKAFTHDLKMVRWPRNIEPSRMEKYDGSTNSAEWLEVYQLTIEAASRDSYVLANYLPVCLSSSTRTWLLGLPAGSAHCWNHLCRLFTSNFRATSARPRVD
jgi:hypothetical protein